MMQDKTLGFTLIELLVSLAIVGLLLGVVFFVFSGTLRSTTDTSSQAALIKEGQIAQQVISGRISDAIFIWSPQMTSEALKTFILGTHASVTPMGNTPWKVETENNLFLASIVPPRESYNATICNNPASTLSQQEGSCYRFVAYYPLRLSSLQSLPVSERPPLDTLNPDTWVLMEYRKPLRNWNRPADYDIREVAHLPSIGVSDTAANVLIGYVQPGSVKFTITPPRNRPLTATQHVSDGGVTVEFQLLRIVGTQVSTRVVRQQIKFTTTSRNWLCKGAVPEICGPQLVPTS